MKDFSQFVISHFEWNPKQVCATFHYHFDNQESFEERISFLPLKEKFLLQTVDQNKVLQLLAHLHIALGVSYYKLFPTKKIQVHTLSLNEDQKKFWNHFYLKGLGEFFYRNQLDPRGLAQFESSESAKNYDHSISFLGEKKLVLFGGGKDSLVTVELLKQTDQDFDLFSFGKDFPLHELAQQMTGQKRLIIQRELDLPQLKNLVEKGYYNGHVPITGTICFVSLVVAYLYGYQTVVTSLEKSADEENTTYCGMDINHQRSKSLEFEQLFQSYVKKRISKDFSISSPLRKRYEIRIIQEFCHYPQYFYHFSSCNRNFHQTGSQLTKKQLRCGICPKCTFIFTLLSAFLPRAEVIQIFDRDLFAEKELLPLFESLLGIQGIKPFECVGTNEEMLLALWMTIQKNQKDSAPVLQRFRNKVLPYMKDSDFLILKKKLLSGE